MEPKRFKIIVTILFLFMFSPISSFAAQDNKERNESVLKRLGDVSMEERNLALFEINENIKNYPLTDEIIETILNLAEKEQKGKEYTMRGELGEEYLSQLIIALGNTKNPRAIPYLIEYLGSGTSVAHSLHRIGEPAIDPLIKKLHDEMIGNRSSASYALGLFLKPDEDGYLAKVEVREKIKWSLIKELGDSRNKQPEKSIEWYKFRAEERAEVRTNIVRALGYLAGSGDTDVIPLIESAAEGDPYFLDMSKKKDYRGPEKKYSVREEAQKVLKKIKEKKGIK